MRKISLTAIFLAAALSAGAQTMYDAMTLSETNYYGTARSISLGNAMTALGGDLGSIGINPAGSAVSPFGQFTLTPGISVASTSSSVSMLDNGTYGTSAVDSKGRFIFPNAGFTMNIETGNRHGVKRYSIGFAVNTTDNHLGRTSSLWRGNNRTSMSGSFAAAASGIQFAELNVTDPYNNTAYPWNTVMALKSEMIATYDTYTDQYLGVTEKIDGSNIISVGGPLSQRAATETVGTNNDMIMNFGMDVDDKLFLGFNLGIPTMRYRYSEAFIESAEDPDDFLINYDGGGSTCFKNSRYQYGYVADVDGIYAKFGIIYVPVTGVRFGAAIKTPSLLTVEEEWQVDGLVNYTTAASTDSHSPKGEWSYSLRTPWEANFGAAFTFGKLGFISVDYEMTDYSVMRFSELHDDSLYSGDTYYQVNTLNRLFCGVQHSLRVGAEFKPLPALALRAGWNLTTSPEKHYIDNLGLTVDASTYDMYFEDFENGTYTLGKSSYVQDRFSSFSLGIGYSSPGSFFADLGARLATFPTTWRKPYADYIFDDTGAVETASPVIRTSRSMVDVALTFGWRF